MAGIEKNIDSLGRVVLPIKYRKKLGLKNNSKVIISMNENSIYISPSEMCCAICGRRCEVNVKFRVCTGCLKEIKEFG